jgi:hypothetical protein
LQLDPVLVGLQQGLRVGLQVFSLVLAFKVALATVAAGGLQQGLRVGLQVLA